MRRAAGFLVLALTLAGCGSEGTSSSAAATSPTRPTLPDVPGITAEAVQQRTDAAIGGQVQFRITDTGAEPFAVTATQLDSPGFVSVPARPVSAQYAPGQTIDLPTPFGAADCSVGVDPVGARVTVRRPDGSTEELLVPLTGSTMAEIHQGECAIEHVLAVVDIAVADLSDNAADAGQTMTADVVLTRRSGGDPVTVTRMGGSVVLEPRPGEDLPVTLAAADRELRIPVTFDAARCDPHALAETKKPYVFPLAVTVGDGDSVPVPLPLDDAQKGQLQALLGRVCTG